ncbi:protein-L-isoaspartate O-methyltransferase family protein [Actinomycetota bacterium]
MLRRRPRPAPRDPVSAAFEAMPREGFLRPGARRRASYDGPLEIGEGQTNSQPRTVEDMLRLLDVRPGQRVLDVGSGSGWTTALLAALVGPEGEVHGVEIRPALAAWGRANVAATGQAWAQVHDAVEGVLGLPGLGPFDRILVSAGARDLPETLVGQLVDGGVMVIPVDSVMLRVVRRGGASEITRHGAYRFVPLR